MASAGEDQTVHPLDPREKAIVTVSAYAAVGDLARLDTALNGGLDAGLTVNEIKELLVQLYAYAGFPRSLNALGAFMTVLEQRQAKGIQDPLGQEPSPFPNDRSSLEFGSDNQTRLVGRPVGGGMYDFAPAIDEFLKAHLFGDIFQRDNLGWRERELATIAILASIDGVNAQLGAHFAIGNYNGLPPAELWAVVDLLGEIMGARCGNNARVVLEGVLNQDN
ncbi:MAG: carboxymuconolactone decarboxylase family protein [Planctomycetes bacterium]|nr:carboxymuconolactone decarboxylase family protein [Planctomycetota bacterium]